MGGLGAIGILRVLDSSFLFPLSSFLRNILRHLAAEGHGEGLDTTTDAQHGYLTVVGETGDEQFGIVTLLVDTMQQGRRFLTSPEGVVVTATTEDQSVDTLEGVDNHMLIGHRRDDDWYATCLHHRLVVALPQLTRQVLIIASDADDRHRRCLWETGIDALQLRLKVELVLHSSMFMGISRFRLCSNEMSVSVATTP